MKTTNQMPKVRRRRRGEKGPPPIKFNPNDPIPNIFADIPETTRRCKPYRRKLS